MYVGRTGSQVSLTGTTMAGNQASDRGGIIAISRSSITPQYRRQLQTLPNLENLLYNACNSVVMAPNFPMAP